MLVAPPQRPLKRCLRLRVPVGQEKWRWRGLEEVFETRLSRDSEVENKRTKSQMLGNIKGAVRVAKKKARKSEMKSR